MTNYLEYFMPDFLERNTHWKMLEMAFLSFGFGARFHSLLLTISKQPSTSKLSESTATTRDDILYIVCDQ